MLYSMLYCTLLTTVVYHSKAVSGQLPDLELSDNGDLTGLLT